MQQTGRLLTSRCSERMNVWVTDWTTSLPSTEHDLTCWQTSNTTCAYECRTTACTFVQLEARNP
jgi:hypothetical protein